MEIENKHEERHHEKVKKKAKKFFKEFRIQAATAIAAAFGFLIALTWRDAISEIINKIVENLGVSTFAYLSKIIAAAVITILCVIGILLIAKWGSKDKEKQEKK